MTNKEILRHVFDQIRPYRSQLIIAMISMVAVAGLSSAQAYLVKPMLDKIFFSKDRQMLHLIPLLLMAVFLFKGIFYFFSNYLLHYVSQSVVRDLRDRIYTHLHQLPLQFFHNIATGELISRIMADVTLMQGGVSQALVGILKNSIQVVGLVGVILYMDWKLALVSCIFLPASVLPIVHFGRKYRRLATANQQTMAELSNIIHETVTGNRIVKAFSMEEYERQRFMAKTSRLHEIILGHEKYRSISHPLMEFLGGVGVALIMWYGGYQVLNGTSTPGTFFSFLTALIMVYEPVKNISGTNSVVQQGLAAAERIFGLLATPPSITEQDNAVVLPPIREALHFDQVSFSYDGERLVLDNVSLRVRAGEVVAIVGPSGSGKTTLVDLVPRFYDVTSGRVTIDGKDVRTATFASLRNQISVVSQQTILFNDTIRNNIAYGNQNRSAEEINAAARAANALAFIRRFPQGLDTVIGEAGIKLSGGERQRLSIARALLKDAPILILDEATSALDNESEREVQHALDNLMRGRTTLVIAHRLSTIKNADRIVVLAGGRIVEEGNHEDLLARGGVYAELYNLQFADSGRCSGTAEELSGGATIQPR